MLNATWLETFATLCDVGHFTRAAAALNMTQPGVSQHVKKLEAQLGQPLLSRDGKSFILTPAGEAVLAIARRRRAEEGTLQGELQHDDPDRGQVSIACSGSLALLLYPRFMDLISKAPRPVHPSLSDAAAARSGRGRSGAFRSWDRRPFALAPPT